MKAKLPHENSAWRRYQSTAIIWATTPSPIMKGVAVIKEGVGINNNLINIIQYAPVGGGEGERVINY